MITARLSTRRSGVRHQVVALALLAAFLAPLAPAAGQDDPADSRWRVRGRVVGIIPDDSSTSIDLEAGATTTALTNGVEADAFAIPEVDVTYMITPHFGVEVIAGISNHDINIDGSDPTLAGLGVTDGMKIFDVWVLPPTVTLQYHFRPHEKIRPYAGFGVNYTAFLWNDATDRLESTLGSPVDVDTSSSWGWAAQAGVDWDIGGNWFLNVDVKYIDVETTASLLVKNLGAGLRVKLDVDPWVVGAGIGYRF